MNGTVIAYFWGDDGYGLEVAIDALRGDVGRFPAGAPERWRIQTDSVDVGRTLGELRARLATGTMFGAGVLAIVSNAGQLVRKTSDRLALIETMSLIAEGNGLVVVEETDAGRKEPPSRALADAIRTIGGDVRRFEAPREGAMAAWIEARAREHQIVMGPGAAKELARRIGGLVHEGDIDRRQQGRLAVMELGKLALLHGSGSDGTGPPDAGRPGSQARVPSAPVTVADVQSLVAEAVPGSVWGFVDSVGQRQRTRAMALLEPLLETTPAPVLLAVLHRRIRELLEIADRLASGETPGSLVRSMHLQPFRAETLARQARAWTVSELGEALEGLLELDALVKGVGGASAGDGQIRLAFDLWVSDRVGSSG